MQNPQDLTNRFTADGVYSCPVCRHGEISAIMLMDAFACNFCNHIFTPNLEQQLLKMADSHLPLTWRWNGRTWKALQQEGMEIGWFYPVAAISLVLFPTALIAGAAYLFPPIPDSSFSWLPLFWIPLTFFSHLALLAWLVMEYYQFPILLYFRAIRRRFLLRHQ